MIASLERVGRPRKPASRAMRMREDLARMLAVIAQAEDVDATDLMEKLFRKQIEKEYAIALNKLRSLQPKRSSEEN